MLIVANFPFAVLGGRIVCPRARGWARPRLSSSARAGQVWLVSLVPAGGREAKQGPRSVASVSSPDRWGSWRMGGGAGHIREAPAPDRDIWGESQGPSPAGSRYRLSSGFVLRTMCRLVRPRMHMLGVSLSLALSGSPLLLMDQWD